MYGSALFNPFCLFVVNRQPLSHGLTTTPADFAVPRADSHCCGSPGPLSLRCAPRTTLNRVCCVCLHALSSFQRTDRWRARGAPPTCLEYPGPLSHSRSHRSGLFRLTGRVACRRRPRLGEPSKVTRTRYPCQPPSEMPMKGRCRAWGCDAGETAYGLPWQVFLTERSRSIAYSHWYVK